MEQSTYMPSPDLNRQPSTNFNDFRNFSTPESQSASAAGVPMRRMGSTIFAPDTRDGIPVRSAALRSSIGSTAEAGVDNRKQNLFAKTTFVCPPERVMNNLSIAAYISTKRYYDLQKIIFPEDPNLYFSILIGNRVIDELVNN